MALGTGRDPDMFGAIERGNFNRRTQECLGNFDLFIQGNVTSLSLEKRVIGNVHFQI
jgi:hypothetical protein